jgi:hypothetical protein
MDISVGVSEKTKNHLLEKYIKLKKTFSLRYYENSCVGERIDGWD